MTEIRADEYWAKKGDVDLFMFRKRLTASENAPVLFMVHGSSFSGPTGFDLQVPGREDYSQMDRFARAGSMSGRWTMKDTGGLRAPTAIQISQAASKT